MASLKDIYDKAKQKLAGEPAEDDFAESYDDEEDVVNYDAINESVQPVTRSVSQFERDFANTSRKSHGTHSAGLDSLFAPSAEENETEMEGITEPMDTVENIEIKNSGSRVSAGNSQDFMTKPDVQVAKTRQVAVIKPDSFEEAEVVTKTLKGGGLVIIDLRQTEGALSKRFLDFSFGATSALGGSVDVLGTDIYSITTGNPIMQSELDRVKNEGLL